MEAKQQLSPPRRKWPKRVAIGVGCGLLVLILLGAGLLFWAQQSVNRVAVTLSGSASGEVWLIVGVDDRAAADSQIAKDVGKGAPGARADLLLLARRIGDETVVLSVDRGLLLRGADGQLDRLAASWLTSPQETVDLLCAGLGVGVDHLVVVNFRALTEAVDALGGIEIELPNALRDAPAHLEIAAGTSRIDGRTALAVIRSRQGEIKVNGDWVAEGTGNQGRQARAGLVAAALAKEARDAGVIGLAGAGLKVLPEVSLDPDTWVWEAAGFAGGKVDFQQLEVDGVAGSELFTSTSAAGGRQLSSLGFAGCQKR